MHSIKYIWILKTYLEHVLVPIYHLWGVQMEPSTDCKMLQMIVYKSQLVLNMAYCTPWRWYTGIKIWQRYIFNIYIYLIPHI